MIICIEMDEILKALSLVVSLSFAHTRAHALSHTCTHTLSLSHTLHLDRQTKGIALEHANFSLVTKLEAISGGEYQIYK